MERGLNIPDYTEGHYFQEPGSIWKDIYIEHPLVYKMGIEKKFDEIIFIDAPEDVRIKRIIERDGCSEETARLIIEKQK